MATIQFDSVSLEREGNRYALKFLSAGPKGKAVTASFILSKEHLQQLKREFSKLRQIVDK